MSNCEGCSDRFVSTVAQTHIPDDVPAILTIRPAPGHPFASLAVCEQERARQPEPPMAETVAIWANLEELAQEWGSFACALTSLTSPASARRYPGRTMTTEQQTAPVAHQRRPLHGAVYVGLTLLCMLVGFIVFSALATWWQQTDDYLHYGMPRTFQMNAVVEHQNSAAHPSHFLALNLGGHLSVIEMQGGDLSKTVIYAGPVIYGQGADLVAVTLSVAHDQRGQPELVLHYQNNEVIFYNGKDGKFHLQPQQ